ncbi:MAG TPA: hypothetical protein VEL07_10000 [Planctomycetota bacterium]|nr:hypothetical protein [Planctomycetota bacterium]
MRACLLVLLACAAVAVEPAWSQAQRESIARDAAAAVQVDGAWHVRTAHYRVRVDAGALLAAEVAAYCELARAAVLAELEITGLRESEPCAVVVYASRARYRAAFSGANSRGRFDWNYASADAAPTYLVATYQADAARGLSGIVPILTHELSHQVLQAAAGRRHIPWLVQEGVATYFQTWNVFRDPAWNRAHRRNEFQRELCRACADDALPTLPALAQLEVWDADHFGPITHTRYGCAESLLGHLLADPSRRPFARRLLRAALDGEDVATLLASDAGRRVEAEWRATVIDQARLVATGVSASTASR